MELNFKVGAEDFNSLSDAEKQLYNKDGDNYVLRVKGAVDEERFKEFRNNNIELQKKFGHVDLEKYNSLVEQEQKLRDKKLIEAGDLDTLVNERVSVVKSDLEGKLNTTLSQLEQERKARESLAVKYEIDGAAHKAFATHKIAPEAQEALMTQIRSRFTIHEGTAVAKDGDKIIKGANGNLTIDEYVASQPEIFKVPSSGGRGAGGKGAPVAGQKSALEKIRSGLSGR